jgi:hypothetical protein
MTVVLEAVDMSVSATNKVDLVSRKKSGEYVLVIVADEPWQDTEDFQRSLQAKLNNYCAYFLDGQMKKEYPDLNQRRITVAIHSATPIPAESVELIKRAARAFKMTGLDIEAEKLPQ